MKKLLAIIGLIGMISASSLYAGAGNPFSNNNDKSVWYKVWEPFVDVTKAALQLAVPTPQSRECITVNVDDTISEQIMNKPYSTEAIEAYQQYIGTYGFVK